MAAGGDVHASTSWANGATAFNAGLASKGISVTQIGGEHCAAGFPTSIEELRCYAAVIISDVSALTLLVTPDARAGRVGVNRLELLKSYVENGGGLMLAGGYLGFQGMFGNGRFYNTAVEDVLPVRCLPSFDGLEVPEGLETSILLGSHSVFDGIDEPFPPILGLNKVEFRQDGSSQILASCSYRGTSWPLLATRDYAKGRTVAWTTDIGLHWLSQSFLEWPHYATLMANIVFWLAGKHRTRHYDPQAGSGS